MEILLLLQIHICIYTFIFLNSNVIFQEKHLFFVNSELHYCSPHSILSVNTSCSFLHHTLNPVLLSSQPSANNHMEEDKWQHPQKSKASEVPGGAGNSQHSAGGLWNL